MPDHDSAGPVRRRLEPTRFGTWWYRRRDRKKRRLAGMSRKRRVFRRLAILFTWLVSFVFVMMVAAVVLFYTLSDVPRPESLPLPQVATMEYSDGSVMARFGTEDRTLVPLSEVPKQVRYDILAAEDRNFYSEPGVSFSGMLRAAYTDLTGGDIQGGSTITQQYAKNAYLSDSRTLSRKLKELAIAVKLDREYSKDQILEFYLNTVYFGRGAYGIETAARAYFGTSVDKLDAAQGAVLAALLRSPSYYDPAVNKQAAVGRWHYVLEGMVTTKHLTAAQVARMTYPKTIKPRNTGLDVTGPTFFIEQRVLAELQAHGISEDELYARGVTIRTTIDKHAQNSALKAISDNFAHLTPAQRNMKNALVAVNPTNGAVLAYYGGPNGTNYAGKQDNIDYNSYGGRPPGSSFKPYTLATVLTHTLQKNTNYPSLAINSQVNGSYCADVEGTQICNDPGDKPVSSPNITIANAMKYSLNTTFDLLASRAGPSNVAKTAHTMGVATTNSFGAPTLVDKDGTTSFGIGIGDYPVTPVDQAVGYATFADGGVRHTPYFVSKAIASDGEVIYEHKSTAKQVIDPKVANDVSLTLQPIAGYSNVPLANGRVSAAKTGTEGIGTTTSDSDAWMVGYTPQVSAAVWVGSGNSTTPIVNSSGGPEYGSDLPGHTWQEFMDLYLQGQSALPMATTQMITGGVNTAPTTSPSTPSTPPSTPSTPPSTPSTPPSSRTFQPPSSPSQPTRPVTTPPISPPTTPTTCTTSVLGQRTCSPGG